jgi:hypothetical protein
MSAAKMKFATRIPTQAGLLFTFYLQDGTIKVLEMPTGADTEWMVQVMMDGLPVYPVVVAPPAVERQKPVLEIYTQPDDAHVLTLKIANDQNLLTAHTTLRIPDNEIEHTEAIVAMFAAAGVMIEGVLKPRPALRLSHENESGVRETHLTAEQTAGKEVTVPPTVSGTPDETKAIPPLFGIYTDTKKWVRAESVPSGAPKVVLVDDPMRATCWPTMDGCNTWRMAHLGTIAAAGCAASGSVNLPDEVVRQHAANQGG